MFSLRPAKIVASLFNLIEEGLSSPVEPDGPSCSCLKCEEAWNRNHVASLVSTRATVSRGFRRVNPG
jgi:hypothetical protein